MRAGERGEDLADTVAEAVTAAVRQQVAYGVDVVTDGEQGKTGFFAYADERLTGFTPRPGARADPWSAEVSAFPEYYAGYFARAMTGGAVVALEPLVCTGPVSYRGQEAIARQIADLRRALEQQPHVEAFPPDPFLTDVFGDPALGPTEKDARAELFTEATNRALRGIPPERVRFHTCYGINEGPRSHDASLADVLPWALKVQAMGDLPARGRSAGDVGQVRRPAGGRGARFRAALAVITARPAPRDRAVTPGPPPWPPAPGRNRRSAPCRR